MHWSNRTFDIGSLTLLFKKIKNNNKFFKFINLSKNKVYIKFNEFLWLILIFLLEKFHKKIYLIKNFILKLLTNT